MIHGNMARTVTVRRGWKELWHLVAAGIALAGMALWLLFGTTGLFAWNDYSRLLDQRRAQLAELKREQVRLSNHRRLLGPGRADPDLGEEMVRSQLNLLHPDDIVLTLPNR